MKLAFLGESDPNSPSEIKFPLGQPTVTLTVTLTVTIYTDDLLLSPSLRAKL